MGDSSHKDAHAAGSPPMRTGMRMGGDPHPSRAQGFATPSLVPTKVATVDSPPRALAPAPRPIPHALEAVHAGFPSVAQDYFNGDFSLDENLIAHPDTTFAVTVAGDSMTGCGIFDGDILLVDRSLTPEDHDVVIAAVDGELTVKRLIIGHGGTSVLHPENPRYPDIALPDASDTIGDAAGTMLWGVVIGNYHWQCSRAQYGKLRR